MGQPEKSVGKYEEDVGAVDLVHDHRPDGDGQPDEHGDGEGNDENEVSGYQQGLVTNSILFC